MYSQCADKKADPEEIFDDLKVFNLVEMVAKIGKESILRVYIYAHSVIMQNICDIDE